jgi:uncharacterized protein with HEPN domain
MTKFDRLNPPRTRRYTSVDAGRNISRRAFEPPILHTEVPWRLVGGLRNRIVRDCFGLDIEIIWQIVSRDLNPLKTGSKDSSAQMTLA